MKVNAKFMVVEVANRDDGRSRVEMAPSRGSRDNTDWSRRPQGEFTLYVDAEYAEKFTLGSVVNVTIDDLPDPPEDTRQDPERPVVRASSQEQAGGQGGDKPSGEGQQQAQGSDKPTGEGQQQAAG